MTDTRGLPMVVGLRERQKEDRRARIIAAAKGLFAESGLENITIEAIADIAGVSGVTVHNYYGTKSGVLLALVAESDRELLETMAQKLSGQSIDLVDLVLSFASIICDHTLTHLNKAIWRQVIAASVSDSDPRFGKLYRELDDRLSRVLIEEVEALIPKGKIASSANPIDLGRALFNVQNMRFIEFISSDNLEKTEVLRRLERDLIALFGAIPA
ncbi:MAG: TetR/AcrR family transcriptional regulator [Candidatus Saccharibacteria bacterium]|nr:TetR/AcrR family transcriptional regulator [Pseudorhodobacter sp.]